MAKLNLIKENPLRTKSTPLFLLIAALFIVASAAFANEPGACAPTGSPFVGPTPPYDYIANGLPNYDGCWAKSNVNFWGGYDACNYYRNFWDFGIGNSNFYQTFYVPSTDNVKRFKLMYILDAIDSHSNSTLTNFRSDVYDLTTGAWLGGDWWSFYAGSLSCAQRTIYCAASSSLAGHQIKVIFTGNRADSAVTLNVKFISLLVDGY
jgi:hypothetical protein